MKMPIAISSEEEIALFEAFFKTLERAPEKYVLSQEQSIRFVWDIIDSYLEAAE